MSKLEPIIPETVSTGTIHKAANHAPCQANIEVASNTCMRHLSYHQEEAQGGTRASA